MKNKYTDFITSIDSSARKELILSLSNIPRTSKSRNDNFLRELVLFESNSILDRKGQFFIVKSVKIDSRKQELGYCYRNAARMMRDGYGYVEGYVIRKNDEVKFSHAWNVDKDGAHLDFTLDNSEQHDYFGIVIPNKLVYEVGLKNGRVWYSVLPFLEETELSSNL